MVVLMRTESTIRLPHAQLTCRRPLRPCLLQLLPQLPTDLPSAIGDGQAETAQVGAVCLVSSSIHLAITHYVRAECTDEDGNDLTPRLARILGTDPATTRRVAAAVADGCRDRVVRA